MGSEWHDETPETDVNLSLFRTQKDSHISLNQKMGIYLLV